MRSYSMNSVTTITYEPKNSDTWNKELMKIKNKED